MSHSTEIDAHDPRCFQRTAVPDDLPADACDCKVWRLIDAEATRVIPPGSGDPA